MNQTLLALCIGGLMAVSSHSVLAQTPPKTGSLGSGSATGLPIMTREELRTCIKQQAELKLMSDGYEARKKQLAIDREALLAETQAVRGDLGDAQAAASVVNDLNRRTEEVANKINEWNTRWTEFQASKRTGPIAERKRRQLIQEQNELTAQNKALDEEREKLGASDGNASSSAAEANARSDALNARTVAWNQRNAALVTEGDKVLRERDLWASECGSRRYREDDEIAIRQGK